jgi:hypothetical protein
MMNFYEATEKLKLGYKVHRKNDNFYLKVIRENTKGNYVTGFFRKESHIKFIPSSGNEKEIVMPLYSWDIYK